jgi:hypothetical protein
MSEAPVLSFVKPGMKRPPVAACVPRSNVSVAWSSECDEPVEVVMPDRYCADLLLEFAAPIVSAELVLGAAFGRQAAGAPGRARRVVGVGGLVAPRSLTGIGAASVREGALRWPQLSDLLLNRGRAARRSAAIRVSGAPCAGPLTRI